MSRRRLAAVAGLTAFLVLAGGGAAAGLWVAHTPLGVQAGAASTGIGQSGDLSGLNVVYDEAAGVYAAAGAVTLTNTGSRAASYSLTATAVDPSVPNLPGAVSIAVGSVPGAGSCSSTATLGAPASGNLASPFVYDSSGSAMQLAAGQSVVLCVQTSLSPSVIEYYGATSLSIAIHGALRYAAGSAWTATAADTTVQQSVRTKDISLFFDYPTGRYEVYNTVADANGTKTTLGRLCKAGANLQPARYADGGKCNDWENQWRLQPVGADHPNEWYIIEARNGYEQPDTPRWAFTGLGSTVTLAAPDNGSAAQRWRIEGRGDGTYRIVATGAVDGQGRSVCATVGGPVWGSGDPLAIVAATCNNALATQGITFTLIPTPLPPKDQYPNGYQLVCSGSPSAMTTIAWPQSPNYQQEVDYRVLFNGAQYVDLKDIEPITNVGYNPYLQITPDDARIQAYWAANGGTNPIISLTMSVQQKITSAGDWITITQDKTIWIQHIGPNNNEVSCAQPTPAAPTQPKAMHCSGSGAYVQFDWDASGISQNPAWALYLQGMNETAPPAGAVSNVNTWLSSGRAYAGLNASDIQSWWAAQGSPATLNGVVVHMYRQLSTGGWVLYAAGTVNITKASYGAPLFSCAG